ncbi:hypothetical protein [Bartonella sp. CB178]|uniref:hypothetical protein n=1 Tax=Bartonella sp. CB178 TaxID=3112255 RepID=UPI00300E4065
MTRRAKISLPNLNKIEPFTKAQKNSVEELSKLGLQSGFTTRHNSELRTGSGRRRRSLKTARITLALEPKVRDVFWELADERNEDGGDFLNHLIESYVNNKYIQNT